MNAPMKFSLVSALIILAIGGMFGVLHQQRLTVLRAGHLQLVAQAGKLGITSDLTDNSGAVTVTKRQRGDRENEAAGLAAELVALSREMEHQGKAGVIPDPAFQKLGLEMISRLMALDATQIKAVIAGLRGDATLTDAARRNILGISMMMLSEEHPAAVLALFTESADMLDESPLSRQVISAALGRWAKDDPFAAMEWIRKNAATHPDLADEDAKRGIIAGSALTDPKLAFKLIGEMHFEDAASAIQAVVEAGKTPAQRTAVLEALREHAATLPDAAARDEVLQESLESMGRNLSDEGFDSVRSWLTTARLSPQESAHFAAGLSYFNTQEDTGRWIDWMGQTLPKDQLGANVDNLLGQWTQQDYQAAGKWLSAAPDGPAKNAAVSTYAGTVAEYEPQTAIQWALTLPAGKERQATLATIYRNWPANDTAAAAEFALAHGIDTEAEK